MARYIKNAPVGASVECRNSTVNLWFDLDKIATETLIVGNDSHTHREQYIKKIDNRMQAKVA